MSTDRETTRIVRSWLEQGVTALPDHVLDAVLDEVPTTPQRRSWWPAWRNFRMPNPAATAAAAAAVLLVAVVGYSLLPALGIVGSDSTPLPSPSPIARGSFVIHDGQFAVELEAIAQGSTATGRMTVSGTSGEDWSFTVDFECTRTTEEGLIMIGGVTTSATGGGSALSPVGRRAAIVLQPGSPVRAKIWSDRGGQPVAFGPSCRASLDAQLAHERSGLGFGLEMDAVEGTIELGTRQ